MRSEILQAALDEMQSIRQANAAEEENRRNEAIERCPEIGVILSDRQNLIYAGIRSILDGEKVDFEAKMAGKNRLLVDRLASIGMPADWLDPIYFCPHCRDTGYVGETIRTACACLMERCNRIAALSSMTQDQEDPCFERFNLELFSSEVARGAVQSQRAAMERALRICQGWASDWPAETRSAMLISGGSGLGKTYLMRCMSRRMIDRGLRVTFLSAFRFVEIARKCHMAAEMEEMEELIRADVVMIDDIGSEPMMNNITIPYLYNLINERQTAGRATVISTNLSPADLKANYSERIASRLTDLHKCHIILLIGDDIRRRK